ncbi:hypothetical protein EGW08_017136 [Elysia chlorotica]|uniref:Uncharacterized protein n=1 Tax=Elysia chlorotica TaxID=188477 RepID=A0A3S1BUD4_ELYCH|nr:hypothetical protein EGW08_017136 [Elysia chlorotica]
MLSSPVKAYQVNKGECQVKLISDALVVPQFTMPSRAPSAAAVLSQAQVMRTGVSRCTPTLASTARQLLRLRGETLSALFTGKSVEQGREACHNVVIATVFDGACRSDCLAVRFSLSLPPQRQPSLTSEIAIFVNQSAPSGEQINLRLMFSVYLGQSGCAGLEAATINMHGSLHARTSENGRNENTGMPRVVYLPGGFVLHLHATNTRQILNTRCRVDSKTHASVTIVKYKLLS